MGRLFLWLLEIADRCVLGNILMRSSVHDGLEECQATNGRAGQAKKAHGRRPEGVSRFVKHGKHGQGQEMKRLRETTRGSLILRKTRTGVEDGVWKNVQH